jgi:peptidoglycan/LPS O-acetylase OafA/YrhL
MTQGSLTKPVPISQENRRNDIQGLRAIAVGTVVAFHAGLPMPGGFLGVDVFFVISGFVITAMLGREWAKSQTIRFSTFYARRFRRLTPALALLVVGVVVLSALIASPMGDQQNAAKTGIGALLLGANIVIAQTTGGYFDAPAAANPLLNTWSLSVEEQFYLIFPLVLFLGWKLAKHKKTKHAPLFLVGIVGGLSFAIAMVEATGRTIPFLPSWLSGFYGPTSRAWEFAAGAILALFAHKIEPLIKRNIGLILGIVGIAGLVSSLYLVTDATIWPGPLTILPVVSTMCLLVAGYSETNAVSTFLGRSPFLHVGNISYSLYLWHWPFIVFALILWPTTPGIAVLAAIASLIPSLISYHWLEQPIRNLRNVSKKTMTMIVAVTIVPPIVLALGLWSAADHGFWNQRVQQFVASVQPMHAGNAAGCNKSIAPSERKATKCVWNANGTGTPVYLVGDSHADHFSEAVIAATTHLDQPLTIATANACPFYDVHFYSTAAPNSPCRQFVQKTLQWLKQQPPGIVILSTSSVYWNSKVFSAGPTADAMTNDLETKRANLQAGLTSTVKQLEAMGNRVVLVQDVPYFASPYASDPHQFSTLEIASGQDLATQMPREFADKNQQAARSAITEVAQVTGASVLDVREFFCPENLCRTQLGETYLYRDDGHISIAGAKKLGPLFRNVLA